MNEETGTIIRVIVVPTWSQAISACSRKGDTARVPGDGIDDRRPLAEEIGTGFNTIGFFITESNGFSNGS
jgi:hypothetical protein